MRYPTAQEIEAWDREAIERYPNHRMIFQFDQKQFSLHFEAIEGVRVDYDPDTDFPTYPFWEILEYLWHPVTGESDPDLTFRCYPDESSFCTIQEGSVCSLL